MPKTTDPTTQQMARMLVEQGMSYGEVGREFGITRQAVHARIKNAGLVVQTGKRRAKDRAAYLRGLQQSHARVLSGKSTPTEEAKKLGYKDYRSYRNALLANGMSYSRPQELLGHGTSASYARGCTCVLCRRANRDRKRRLIGREPPNHGTESGYTNYGCRCRPCTKAATAATNERRMNRRAKTLQKGVNA